MKENFKIEKELLFKNNIKEITSISLDRDFKVNKNEVEGNFVINGDYKIHEVSINREKFNFKIPFKHIITNDIDDTTIDIEITDFLYDYNKDELMVNIEYDLIGDRKDILIFDNEETLDEFLNKREVEVIDTRIEDIKKDIAKDTIKEEIKLDNLEKKDKETSVKVVEDRFIIEKEVNKNEQLEELKEIDKIEIVENEDREIKTEEIINHVNNIQDKFIKYKIYKVMENDTLEGIVLKYHTNVDEIKEYNELTNISVGDKIIIPINE